MTNNGWRFVKLVDLCDSIDYGYTDSALDLPVGPHFLRITDIVGGFIDWKTVPFCRVDGSTKQKYSLQTGDIVIARTGASTGTSAYINNPPEAIFASYLIRLKIKKEADSPFIAYYLKSPNFKSFMQGVLGDKSAQPNASAKTMTQVNLKIPPLDEQQAIASILGALDDKIELNRKMNETLETIAQAIFKSWFVDFDPVKAKAEGRQPYGMDAKTAALFPDSFADSALGKIPKGWRLGKIDEICQLGRDAINPSKRPGVFFDHYSIPAFDERRYPKAELGSVIKSNKYIVAPQSVLLSKLNPRTPRIWLPHIKNERPSVCSTEFLVALPKVNISREYLYSLFSDKTFLQTFAGLVTGTSGSHQRVKPEFLLNMSVVVPSEPCLKYFSEIVQPFYKRVQQNIEECQTLAKVRDTLLPKLMSGEIRLKEIEKQVEARV